MSGLIASIFCQVDPSLLSLAFFFDDDSNNGGLLFLLLLAGPIFYGIMYSRYRNAGKRHTHERETPATMSNLRSYDNFVKHLKKQDHKKIKGSNEDRVNGSLVKNANKGTLDGFVSQIKIEKK